MNLTQAKAQVRANLRDLGAAGSDAQLLTDDEIEPHVLAAVARYSNDRPQVTVVDLTADGTAFLAVPAAFEVGWSTIRWIEWPVVADAVPTVMDSRAWMLWDTPDGKMILWLDTKPASGDTVRVHYTARHAMTSNSTTVPIAHDYAVVDLATSFGADAIAAKYASTVESTFGADTANFRTKQQEWSAVARRYRDRYVEALRAMTGFPSGRINWDSRSSLDTVRINHSPVGR